MNALVREPRSQSIEDYLKVTYQIQEQSQWVTTSALAERLGHAPSSITNMVQKLQKLGYLDYTPYYGFRLTDKGKRLALGMLRHHRLLELFLVKVLGYTWDRVHEEAERLEHVVSGEFVERIDRLLGHPRLDPHGDPIPTEEGRLQETTHPRLLECFAGESVMVRRVSDASGEFLRYAAELGLVPDARIEVVECAPFEGPIRIRVQGKDHYIGRDAARRIFVERKNAKSSKPKRPLP
ncbi:MAG: metal-dependent transcriptional regulator [Acidobacteria bacterium]|nr:metal-dependent transcriptional regulator [Acidobacteriota bacterium]